MNHNEAIIIDRMAECLENNQPIRWRFELLHSGTQRELLARVPYLLQDMTRVERLNAIVELKIFCSVEA